MGSAHFSDGFWCTHFPGWWNPHNKRYAVFPDIPGSPFFQTQKRPDDLSTPRRHSTQSLQSTATEQVMENGFCLIFLMVGHGNLRRTATCQLQGFTPCSHHASRLSGLSSFWHTPAGSHTAHPVRLPPATVSSPLPGSAPLSVPPHSQFLIFPASA